MIIVHYRGEGRKFMTGVKEYITLHESLGDFIGDCSNLEEAKKDWTAFGFTVQKIYNTEVDTDFSALPMDRALVAQY